MTSNTARRRTCSTIRSKNSREVGSIQCASSNVASTGRPRDNAANWLVSASNNFSRFFCGLKLSSAAALGSDSNSLNSANSLSLGMPGASTD